MKITKPWPEPTEETPSAELLNHMLHCGRAPELEPHECECECGSCTDGDGCTGYECECECGTCENTGECPGHSCDCDDCTRGECPGCRCEACDPPAGLRATDGCLIQGTVASAADSTCSHGHVPWLRYFWMI